MGSRATIKDVARESGVDVSTVSRCLNGAGRVNPETRDRIRAVAARLLYRPNRMARGLVTGRTHSIGLIISDIRNPFFAELARGAEDAAYAAGCDVVLCNTDLRFQKQLNYIRSLAEKGVDGIIVNHVSEMNREQEDELLAQGLPVVLLSRPECLTRISTVTADNFQGGYLAGAYLAGLGHRALAVLSGPRHQSNHEQRVDGFQKGAAGTRIHVFHGHQSFDGGYEMTLNLLEEHPEVTAIFTGNDVMAFGCFRALSERHRAAPDGMSVVGFDNIEWSGMMQTPLTTIEQPKYEIGKCAVDLLLDLARNGAGREPVHKRFEVRLVQRGSARHAQGWATDGN